MNNKQIIGMFLLLIAFGFIYAGIMRLEGSYQSYESIDQEVDRIFSYTDAVMPYEYAEDYREVYEARVYESVRVKRFR